MVLDYQPQPGEFTGKIQPPKTALRWRSEFGWKPVTSAEIQMEGNGNGHLCVSVRKVDFSERCWWFDDLYIIILILSFAAQMIIE